MSDLHDDDYFENYAGGSYIEHSAEREYEAGLRLAWLAAAGVSPPGELLEIGAAAGLFLAAAKAVGWDARGVEANDTVAAHARDVLGVDVVTGMLEDQELPEAGFDAVVLWHVLEHIPEPKDAIALLRRALKPGGRLAIEVPNVSSLEALAMAADWPHLADPQHVSHFTPVTLRLLLEQAGFVLEELDTVPFGYYAQRRSTRILWKLAAIRRERRVTSSPHPSAHPLLRAIATRPN